MKRTILAIVILLSATAAAIADTQRFGPGRGGTGRSGPNARGGQLGIISALPHESLSQTEVDALMLMRQEEKLARDVYLALYERWNIPAFLNIAGSEQRHFDAVGTLIAKYDLNDPVQNEVGGFVTGSEFEAMYRDLVATGETSQEEALRVGATIEDLDIYDLRRLLEEVDNRDIQIVFQNLLNGSMNHLRAFTRLLQPEVYEAQYLSQEELEEIINAPRERGRYGRGRGTCRSETDPGSGNWRRGPGAQ